MITALKIFVLWLMFATALSLVIGPLLKRRLG